MATSTLSSELQGLENMRGNIKCGVVQMNLDRLALFFTCVYCEEELYNLKHFAHHFQQHVVMTDAENELFLKNIEEESIVAEVTETVQELSNDAAAPDCVKPLKYEIEMLDDSLEDNVEFLSNQEDGEGAFVYQVKVFENDEAEKQIYDTSQTLGGELQQLTDDETPTVSFGEMLTEDDPTNVTNFEDTNDVSYVCDICGIKFAEEATLQVHRQRHNRCQLCLINFPSKAQLKIHIRTHLGEKPFVCEECGQSFKNAISLNLHKKRHVTEQLHACNTCGKTFYEERALRDHIKTHTISRPFICVECNMTFSRQKALMLHASMHSDVRKFSCTICRMTFAQNSGLIAHMQDKHRSYCDYGVY